MAWFSSNISLGNIADLAGGAVNKLQESVKSIEKNFDNALGFEEKEKEKADSSGEASGLWTSATDRKSLFNPVIAFMGQKNEEIDVESSQKSESLESDEVKTTSRENESLLHPSISDEKEGVEADRSTDSATEQTAEEENKVVTTKTTDEHPEVEGGTNADLDRGEYKTEMPVVPTEQHEPAATDFESSVSVESSAKKEMPGVGENLSSLVPVQENSRATEVDQVEGTADQSENVNENMNEQKAEVESIEGQKTQDGESVEVTSTIQDLGLKDNNIGDTAEVLAHAVVAEETDRGEKPSNNDPTSILLSDEASEAVPECVANENNSSHKEDGMDQHVDNIQSDTRKVSLQSGTNASDTTDSLHELEKVKTEMKMMESALLGAARQAQAKADEIAKLMTENEQLKGVIEDLKRKPSEAEIETLREEYHQRVATLERKVYALTKERDTLRREQNKKSDAALLLKEKDEIITQVMAEGEELSKKQAAQEAQMRKLRAQIRELEEDKKGLTTKLQVEENKVDSIKKDKAATEKLLQETIERHQSELALQKEFYTNALAAAKEAEALAEARANDEARSELESRLREVEERESMLVHELEELRQTLNRKEQQAVFREEMHRREVEDLQKRYQASERRCEELITQVPDSTRPLLRQIEAMQETTARRAEAWAAVERSLNSRLQEAEAKAASAEERERSVNERLSQTLSRVNVLEAQISCLRAEQTQLSKSLEKERQRAAENRQEYLVVKEEADTQESRANQLEEEIRELKRKHKQDLHEALTHRELLQQEIDKEKAARLDLERTARVHSASVSDQPPIRQNSAFENGSLSRRPSSASSLGSMEESYYLQASLDSSDNYSERRNAGEATISPYYMKSMTPGAFESALRQKEGELASYMSRLSGIEYSVSVFGGFFNSEMRGRQRAGSKDHASYNDKEESGRLLSGKEFARPPWKRSLPHMLVAIISSFLFGYHLGVVNETLESMSIDLDFSGSTMAEGLVVSTCLGGAFVGCLFSGWLADEVGRRRAFQLCALPMIIGASVSATTKGLWGMLLGRFLVGTGMGIGPSVTALYVAEISPAYVRGAFGSSTQIATCLGLMAALFIGLPSKEILGWWRVCFWVASVPAAALAFLMEFCAESPHWLFKKGRGPEAEAELEKLLGAIHVKSVMTELSKSDRGDESDSVKFSELFYGRHFKVVFMGSALFAFQQLSGINAVFYFSSTVFKSFGVPSDLANTSIGISNLLGSIIAMTLMDKLGRKVLLLGSFSGMVVSLGLQVIGASYFATGSGALLLSIGGMLLFVLMFSLGAGPVPSLLLSEIFSSRIRAKAMAVCMAVHWLVNFFVGLLFLRLLEQIGAKYLYAIFAAFCFAAVIFVKRNVVETKGKTLQEIELALVPPE